MMEIQDIIRLFHKETPLRSRLREIRLEQHDSRWTLQVDFPKASYMIKLAANGFTTEARVSRWNDIINAYRQMGYYSPALLPSMYGRFAEKVVFRSKPCIVWEEEFAAFPLRETLDQSVYTGADGRYVYHDEVFAFLGKVAEKRFSFFPYPSGWARFVPFEADATTDEVMECVQTLDALVRTRAPQFLARWEQILLLFHENRKKLEAIYGGLPTSVFQADTIGNNLLLDATGHFKGVIDYNLAGEDTALNMFLSMILFGYSYHRKRIHAPGLLNGLNRETQGSIERIVLETLSYLRGFYRFSPLEAKAAPLLYQYISSIEYAEISAFKQHADDTAKLSLLFDFMESQLSNHSIPFEDAMLG